MVQLRFSGAVGGGTPVLDFGKTCSMGDELIGIRGILNEDCNYILTRIEQQGVSSTRRSMGEEVRLRGDGPIPRHRRLRQRSRLVIMANHLQLSKAGIRDVKVSG